MQRDHASRPIRWLLASLFVLVPLAVLPWSFQRSQIKDVLLLGVVAVCAAAWLWWLHRTDRPRIGLSLLGGVLAVYTATWVVSLLASPHPHAGLSLMSVRLAGLGLLLLLPVVLGRKQDLRLVLALLLGTSALMSVYGILQFLRLDPFRSTEGLVGHFRVSSFTAHPNVFISYLVACLPLNIAAFRLFGPRRRTRVLLVAVLALNLSAAAATLSRAGIAALLTAVAICVLFIHLGHRKNHQSTTRPLLWRITVAVIGATALVCLGIGFRWLDRGEPERFFSMGGPSVQKRMLIYGAAMDMASTAPLLGKGLGTFSLYLPAFRQAELAGYFPQNAYHVSHAASEPMEILAESGALGLAGWLLLIAAFIAIPLTSMKRVTDPGLRALLAAAAAGTIGLVLHGLVEVSLRFEPPCFMFWALPGLALAARRAAGVEPKFRLELDLGSLPRRLAVTVPVVLCLGLGLDIALAEFASNVHLHWGQSRLERGEVAAAERSLRLAVHAWPANLPARYRHAYTLWKLGKLDESARAYADLLKKSPYYFDANRNLAYVLYDQSRYVEAACYLKVATRINPHNAASRDLAQRVARKLAYGRARRDRWAATAE